jgi:prevent-host-death family protein
MRRLSAGSARERFAEIVADAAFGEKRTVITRHGKEVAAIVPISDLDAMSPTKRKIPAEAVLVSQTSQIFTVSGTSAVQITLSRNNG